MCTRTNERFFILNCFLIVFDAESNIRDSTQQLCKQMWSTDHFDTSSSGTCPSVQSTLTVLLTGCQVLLFGHVSVALFLCISVVTMFTMFMKRKAWQWSKCHAHQPWHLGSCWELRILNFSSLCCRFLILLLLSLSHLLGEVTGKIFLSTTLTPHAWKPFARIPTWRAGS